MAAGPRHIPCPSLLALPGNLARALHFPRTRRPKPWHSTHIHSTERLFPHFFPPPPPPKKKFKKLKIEVFCWSSDPPYPQPGMGSRRERDAEHKSLRKLSLHSRNCPPLVPLGFFLCLCAASRPATGFPELPTTLPGRGCAGSRDLEAGTRLI